MTELALHGWCREIALAPLGLQAIASYLEARLGDVMAARRSCARWRRSCWSGPAVIRFHGQHRQSACATGGSNAGAIVAIPHDVRRFIDRQIDELTESDRHLLTAASVIRREFSTAAVAAALEIDIDQVEIACARLARQGVFVVKSGSTTWPDGTRTSFMPSGTISTASCYTTVFRRPAVHSAIHGSAGGSKPRGPAGWTRSLPSWPSISSVATSRCVRSRITSAPRTRPCAASADEEAIGHLRRALDAIGHIAGEVESARVEVGFSSRSAPPSSPPADSARQRCSKFTPGPRR